MARGISSFTKSARLGAAALGCLIILAFGCPAQKKGSPKKKQQQAPRVGTLKDYPATGLMTGCGNMYFHFEHEAGKPDAGLVYGAYAGGRGAWMNLDGRDVHLRKIKSLSRETRRTSRYFYRYGRVSVSVFIESIEPRDGSDWTMKMKITVRRGRAVRTVRALGEADC